MWIMAQVCGLIDFWHVYCFIITFVLCLFHDGLYLLICHVNKLSFVNFIVSKDELSKSE
jgi:hypothetical protein